MINFAAGVMSLFLAGALAPNPPETIEDVFSPEHRNGLVMKVEAAIASAQAKNGVISRDAAREINRTATIDYAPIDKIAAENKIVRHRMVALLNVWRRYLESESKFSALSYKLSRRSSD